MEVKCRYDETQLENGFFIRNFYNVWRLLHYSRGHLYVFVMYTYSSIIYFCRRISRNISVLDRHSDIYIAIKSKQYIT